MARKDGLSPDGLKCAVAQRRHDRRSDRLEALHRSAERAIEAMNAKREKAAAKAKVTAKIAKEDKASKRQGGSEVNRLVTKEAQRNGDYQFVPFELIEVTEGGRRIKKETKVVRNLARTQVERWLSRGRLDERQAAAILFYQEAFRKAFGEGARVTASYSPVIIRGLSGATELWASSGVAARESLRLLDQEVFFRVPVEWFPVWQNVVIWDEPAGVAGSRAGFVHKPAEAAAYLIVTAVAKMVADIVIDSSRKDFGDLLVDLDAARKPGRKP